MTEPENTNEVTQTDNTVENGDISAGDINKQTYYFGRVPFEGKSQLEILYDKLEKEKKESTVFSDIVDELLHYKNNADDTDIIGLEKKLENGNRLKYLSFAEKSRLPISSSEFQPGIKVDISIGVTLSKDNDTKESILKRVDVALYEAKSAGRNCTKYL